MLEDLYFLVGLSKDKDRRINEECVLRLKNEGYVFYNRSIETLKQRYHGLLFMYNYYRYLKLLSEENIEDIIDKNYAK